jgi:hypothetical protein
MNCIKFISSYKTYKRLSGPGSLSRFEICPRLKDDTPKTGFDAHYFYQGVWAFSKIVNSGAKNHVDVGSEVRWVGLLSAVSKVVFIDIRPPEMDLKDITVKKGSALDMPFGDNSVESLSCLHVAEHIGLGRYGDVLDPEGTSKACRELSRVLAAGGNLYFSVPVGRPKICFNAHRIHSVKTILDYFKDLKLAELSGVTDKGQFVENINIDTLEKSDYACGLFWLRK